jgi:hypothetical protein
MKASIPPWSGDKDTWKKMINEKMGYRVTGFYKPFSSWLMWKSGLVLAHEMYLSYRKATDKKYTHYRLQGHKDHENK